MFKQNLLTLTSEYEVMIQNYWSNGNISDSFRRICSKLQYSLKVLSFDIAAVLHVPELTIIWWFFGDCFCSVFTTVMRSWTPENFLSAGSSFKRGQNQKLYCARLRLCTEWGKNSSFVLQDTELRPLFSGDWHRHGGGWHCDGAWVLAADLLDNFWVQLLLHNISL